MFNYSGLVFDVTGGVCCNLRCQTYLESNSNFFCAHFAELKHLSELSLVDFIFQTLLHAKLCQQTEYDSKGAVRTFFSQNFWFCLKVGGGLTKTQVFCAIQILPWNCQNTWDKILGQSAKKIWARSPLKQQTLINDTLLNSCSRDPTFCVMNVHLFGV